MRLALLLAAAAALFSPVCAFAQDIPQSTAEPVFEAESLLANGGFEKGAPGAPDQPARWRSDAPAASWQVDRQVFLQGSASLRMAGGATVQVVSDAAALDAGFTGLSAVAMARGTGGTAKVRWLARDGSTLREDPLRAVGAPDSGGWVRHTLGETAKPENAERVACLLEANTPEGQSVWWDAVELTGNFERKAEALVLINQAGYESFAPKRFVVSSNLQISGATFKIVTHEGRTAAEGTLEDGVRVTGAEGADWGRYFYRGDFTPLDDEGNYTVRVALGDLEASSQEFTLRFDQLWASTFNPAVHALAACRNEGSGPLWNDPGKPALSDAEAYWTLVNGLSILRWKVNLLGGASPLADEVLWATPRAVQRAEGAAPDVSRFWAAGLARDARENPSDTAAAEAAKKAVTALKDSGANGPLAFSAAWDLHAVTQDPVWKELAKAWYPGINLEAIEPLLEYEDETGEAVSVDLARSAAQLADTLLKRARNPFGVYATEDKGVLSYFLPSSTEPVGTPEGMGNTHRVLMAAELVAKAYRFQSKPEYLAFIYDQFNWVLGCNPFGVCLMEGAGMVHVAKLAGAAAERRDALKGAILNGIGPAGPGDDRPWIAVKETDPATEATNGFALRNNVRFIGAMAQLKRIRTVQPQDKLPK